MMRVPYPMGFHSRGVDGRIDDPKAGWKGRGIYATYGADAAWHIEGGPGRRGIWSSSRSGPTRSRSSSPAGFSRPLASVLSGRPRAERLGPLRCRSMREPQNEIRLWCRAAVTPKQFRALRSMPERVQAHLHEGLRNGAFAVGDESAFQHPPRSASVSVSSHAHSCDWYGCTVERAIEGFGRARLVFEHER